MSEIVVSPINNGIVLDHITAGKAMEIYDILHLDSLKCAVAIIRNCSSKKMGRKDILKIDEIIDLDFDVLGYIDPGITVNIIQDGKIADRLHLELPEKIENVIVCKNPRCITSIENIDQVFRLTDRKNGVYRCVYCESKANRTI